MQTMGDILQSEIIGDNSPSSIEGQGEKADIGGRKGIGITALQHPFLYPFYRSRGGFAYLQSF
jgi:hypothetical protein